MSFHAVGQAPLPNFYGPGPAGVPNPYSGRVHNYPTRYHGAIYTRPMYKLPERRNPIEWGGGPGGYSGMGAFAPPATIRHTQLWLPLSPTFATWHANGWLTKSALDLMHKYGRDEQDYTAGYSRMWSILAQHGKTSTDRLGGKEMLAELKKNTLTPAGYKAFLTTAIPGPDFRSADGHNVSKSRTLGMGCAPCAGARGFGFLDDVTLYWSARSGAGSDPQVKAYQDVVNAQLVAQGYAPLTADGHIGPGLCGAVKALTADGVTGLEMPKACVSYRAPVRVSAPQQQATPTNAAEEPKKVLDDNKVVTSGSVPSPTGSMDRWYWPPPSQSGGVSDVGADYQQQINDALYQNGYAQIGEDGKLGSGTCGAIELLNDIGIPAPSPKNCRQPNGQRWWTSAGQGKSYPKPAFVGKPKPVEEPKKTADEPKKVTTKEEPIKPSAEPCKMHFGVSSQIAREVQQSLNVALVSAGYVPLNVTNVFDAATLGVMLFIIDGKMPKEAVAPPVPPSCKTWGDVITFPKEYPANPPPPQKAKVTKHKKKHHRAAPPPKKEEPKPIVCGHGLVLHKGKCVKPAPHCKKGQVLKKGHCVWPAVKCGTGFHVEGRECVKDVVVASIAKHGKKECPKGFVLKGKHCVKKAAAPPAAEASMFSSPAVWIGSAVVLGGLAWFLTRKKSGSALAKAA